MKIRLNIILLTKSIMGNRNDGNRKLGHRAECPSCGQEFAWSTTHFAVSFQD